MTAPLTDYATTAELTRWARAYATQASYTGSEEDMQLGEELADRIEVAMGVMPLCPN